MITCNCIHGRLRQCEGCTFFIRWFGTMKIEAACLDNVAKSSLSCEERKLKLVQPFKVLGIHFNKNIDQEIKETYSSKNTKYLEGIVSI